MISYLIGVDVSRTNGASFVAQFTEFTGVEVFASAPVVDLRKKIINNLNERIIRK
jgi:hypothetical protein